MKHTALISALSILALTVSGESAAAEEPFVPPSTRAHTPIYPASALPPGHPVKGSGSASKPSADAADDEIMEQATVVSTIDIPGFTYIEIKRGHQTHWLAAKSSNAKKGAVIEFDSGMALENFHSKVLDRTFPSMTFVNTVTIVKEK